mmetsp:Transcript_37549/g.79794  ORF Transcript_37549/g.79794 Transcript_37549/m.79794 type:complete len:226 (+) Transcript_37549:1674-2351(+)
MQRREVAIQVHVLQPHRFGIRPVSYNGGSALHILPEAFAPGPARLSKQQPCRHHGYRPWLLWLPPSSLYRLRNPALLPDSRRGEAGLPGSLRHPPQGCDGDLLLAAQRPLQPSPRRAQRPRLAESAERRQGSLGQRASLATRSLFATAAPYPGCHGACCRYRCEDPRVVGKSGWPGTPLAPLAGEGPAPAIHAGVAPCGRREPRAEPSRPGEGQRSRCSHVDFAH